MKRQKASDPFLSLAHGLAGRGADAAFVKSVLASALKQAPGRDRKTSAAVRFEIRRFERFAAQINGQLRAILRQRGPALVNNPYFMMHLVRYLTASASEIVMLIGIAQGSCGGPRSPQGSDGETHEFRRSQLQAWQHGIEQELLGLREPKLPTIGTQTGRRNTEPARAAA